MATPGNTPTAKVGTLGLGAALAATPAKSQRGQNKPKCKQCGNVARSRCPYEACKSCCARNQNPCAIHVLKANSTFPDKSPSSGGAQLDQQSFEPSSSVCLLGHMCPEKQRPFLECSCISTSYSLLNQGFEISNGSNTNRVTTNLVATDVGAGCKLCKIYLPLMGSHVTLLEL